MQAVDQDKDDSFEQIVEDCDSYEEPEHVRHPDYSKAVIADDRSKSNMSLS